MSFNFNKFNDNFENEISLTIILCFRINDSNINNELNSKQLIFPSNSLS